MTGEEILLNLLIKYPENRNEILHKLRRNSFGKLSELEILFKIAEGNFETLHAMIMDETAKKKYIDHVLR